MEEYYKKGALQKKSYDFALRIIKTHNDLQQNKEFVLSGQLLRSGTSIGANCRDSRNAQSTLDFINKLNIALKEADETAYWLELLRDGQFITEESFDSIYNDCMELVKMLTKIIKTTKEKYIQ